MKATETVVPVGHKLHASDEFEPILMLKVPGLQGVQIDCPLLENVPAGQSLHSTCPLLENVPALHLLQADCPILGLKEPPSHRMHAAEEFEPAILLKVPAGHRLHSDWPVLGLY